MAEYQFTPDTKLTQEAMDEIARSIVSRQHRDRIMVNPEPVRVVPGPTPEQENDPLFQAVWQTIKDWKIKGADGNPVLLIFEAVKSTLGRE